MSTLRRSADVNTPAGSNRYFITIPTDVFASRAVALMHVRAWREVPLKSTSSRPPRFVTATRIRYSSESSTPSQSTIASPVQLPSGMLADPIG